MGPLLANVKIEDLKCESVHKNLTKLEFVPIHLRYVGIPENLIMGLTTFIVLVPLLFSILRKWTKFYNITKENGHNMPSKSSDEGFLTWIPAAIRITDNQIEEKCGMDAVLYLTFSRLIIYLICIVTVVALFAALPVNFMYGTLYENWKDFSRTTMGNLLPVSPYMWIHNILAFVLSFITFIMIWRYLTNLHKRIAQEHSVTTRTLMISGVSKSNCSLDNVSKHFADAYPLYTVTNIQIAYNVLELTKLKKEKQMMFQAYTHCSKWNDRTGKHLEGHKHGERFCILGRGCPLYPFGVRNEDIIDMLEYYGQKLEELEDAFQEEKGKVLAEKNIGIVFVTFDKKSDALRVIKDYKQRSSYPNNVLKEDRWTVRLAPPRDDIIWDNLHIAKFISNSRFRRIFKAIGFDAEWSWNDVGIHLASILLLIFLSTPSVVISVLFDPVMNVLHLQEYMQKSTPIIWNVFPSFLMLSVSVALPVIVSKMDQWVGHWFKSMANYARMMKTTIFLLFMVAILPFLGLKSASLLFESTLKGFSEIRWQCVFLPNNGAFFVQYVLTSALIGLPMELLRFSDWIFYIIGLLGAKSSAEAAGVRNSLLDTFYFGVSYAWMISIFTIIIIFSLACPLITPFGLLYFVIKYFVDRYNIYFEFDKASVTENIHQAAAHFVMFAFALLMCTMFVTSFVRVGWAGITTFALIGFVTVLVFMIVLVGRPCVSACTSEEDSEEIESPLPSESDLVDDRIYLPKVLRDTDNVHLTGSRQKEPNGSSNGSEESCVITIEDEVDSAESACLD